MKQQNNVVIVGQSGGVNIGFFSVLLLAWAVIIFFQYFWYILAGIAVVSIGALAYRAMWLQSRREHALRARADQQNRQFLEGDPHGLFGDFDEGPQ